MTANSRSTNSVQGDIQAASIGTFMAINGDGFFVVQKPSDFVDNRPVFDGVDLYTRRGDFQPDKSGYLVNGAGYYLMGIPIDADHRQPGRQRAAGAAVPERLPARAGDHADRLPRQPGELSADHGARRDVPGSELLNPGELHRPIRSPVPPQNAKIIGTGATIAAGCRRPC